MPTQAELQALWETGSTTPTVNPAIPQEELEALWQTATPAAAPATLKMPYAEESFNGIDDFQEAYQPQIQPAGIAPGDVPTEEALAAPPFKPASPEPTLQQKGAGVAETALSALTGATGGSLGMLGGTIEGIYEAYKAGKLGTPEGTEMAERIAIERAGQLTYEPRTETGMAYTQEMSEALAPLQAIGPGAPPAISRVAAPGVAVAAKTAAVNAKNALQKSLSKKPAKDLKSIGASQVEDAALRQLRADELPVSMKLTKGQRERGLEQVKFEQETAKQPEGQMLRERFNEQNLQIQQNLDEFIDQTGAQAYELRDIGISVDKALKGQMSKDKDKISALYKKADESGETTQEVELTNFIKHLNETAPEAEVASILKVARQKAINLGAAQVDESGSLVPTPISIKNSEILRKAIRGATDVNPVNIRQSTISKGLIDYDTKDAGGNLYKAARAERARFSNNYSDISLLKRLTNNKPGTSERRVALEGVLDEIVLKSSVDSIRHARRVLHRAGEEGKQAWRDVQGGALKHIRDQALKNMQRDENGNPVPSPAAIHRTIDNLDKSGKLDFVFTKKGAEALRTIDEVAQDLLTYPRGSVNYSNTASALLTGLDTLTTFALTQGTIPFPVMTAVNKSIKAMKGRRVKKKVKKALK